MEWICIGEEEEKVAWSCRKEQREREKKEMVVKFDYKE